MGYEILALSSCTTTVWQQNHLTFKQDIIFVKWNFSSGKRIQENLKTFVGTVKKYDGWIWYD